MARVHVLVEGQTEETFVREVLKPHFNTLQIYLTERLVGKRGGIGRYERDRRDLLTLLKQDREAYCTTMLDYYGMPASWPGREAASVKRFADKSVTIEQAILTDVCTELGEGFDPARLIPYVQMHEFEALLFSEAAILARGLALSDDSEIRRIRDQFPSPEQINDSQQTAPSKRIKRLDPGYNKVADGVLIAQKIGLPVMRAQCPHFGEWIGKLEALAEGR